VPGVLILLTQIAWIPFWAAGVINGVGHWFGYRNNPTEDASTNMVPWGVWIGGEELRIAVEEWTRHHVGVFVCQTSQRDALVGEEIHVCV
jgi:fatty-acid desaturase